jgi:hypothetical protein
MSTILETYLAIKKFFQKIFIFSFCKEDKQKQMAIRQQNMPAYLSRVRRQAQFQDTM